VGARSAAQSIKVSNSGTAALSISKITIGGTNPGDFAQTNTCGSSVAAGGSCAISVTFAPTAAGTRSASVSVSDDASGSPQTVPLSGTGTTVSAGFLPASLNFASHIVGARSAVQNIKVSNSGTAAPSIGKITVGGTNPGQEQEHPEHNQLPL
jgi:FlaG/FlaF family flagellin (archaellin)